MTSRHDKTVRALLDRHGRTFAADAGIKLADRPAPLFQLLVLATLLSTRIRGDIAVAAARALRDAGWTTARGMAEATWAQRTKVLNRSGYARYDERTSRMLGDTAVRLGEQYGGDLRRLREHADGDVDALRASLTTFKGIGGVGADVFLREVQGVWPELRPFVDSRAGDGAKALGLPSSPRRLAGLVDGDDFVRLVAALVRVTIDNDADEVRRTARAA
ncbi:MAG: endonuclease [Streptosporangiales bacterium]|nr:endonuclease [Streptosporangiales bacterium]MBO0892230.1 endonuclease [Acidothermales bacterium]